MGASGWDYRAPYAGSVDATLIAVRERALASGDYLWPWEEFDAGETVPRPTTLAELDEAMEAEEFWDVGTHSILDVRGVATEDSFSAIRPLSARELDQVFGTRQPSAADFERVQQAGALAALEGESWSGRSVVIHRNGSPEEVYFWGHSGD
ncbi:hypothetical protein FHX82_001567 [Amycolatopsis bartoniae]|uniref:Uncharacterized protein n=1 Tax=Amycolatopsis bartoniae TaxID=941986 RepID=A0A8H9IYB6_9PSEU|nr:hypothetical protein [Amycolatopsis bartoniae]MBB2934547.1 hypothetical protein [Amycolatopsis bartoniae]TVT06882.1 hypothetical protein FNH07_18205 [Amycolatopsis bartoniae]GHF46565.1 hypothetical protein GCM10017566_19610 [Amycolatopsis bartoniae]